MLKLTIQFLDHFPYGKVNRIRFFIEGACVTKLVGGLIKQYWGLIGASEDMDCYVSSEFKGYVFHVETGEGFGQSDFTERVGEVIALPQEVVYFED